MDNIFQSLCTGTKFNTKKIPLQYNNHQKKIFNQQQQQHKEHKANVLNRSINNNNNKSTTVSKSTTALDFFGKRLNNNNNNYNNNNSKKSVIISKNSSKKKKTNVSSSKNNNSNNQDNDNNSNEKKKSKRNYQEMMDDSSDDDDMMEMETKNNDNDNDNDNDNNDIDEDNTNDDDDDDDDDSDSDSDSDSDPEIMAQSKSKMKLKKKMKNKYKEDKDTDKIAFIKDEEIRAFRKRMHIHVNDAKLCPHPIETFYDMLSIQNNHNNNINNNNNNKVSSDHHMKNVIIKNVEDSQWKEPTPIQMQAIPIICEGHDIMAAAPTGSGKTAAFVIPTLIRLNATKTSSTSTSKSGSNNNNNGGGIRGLLLAPTRELASQIYRETIRLSQGKKFRICLLSKVNAAQAIANGSPNAFDKYDIMVCTPMRLCSLIQQKCIRLNHVEIVVLDEADKLFEVGQDSKEMREIKKNQKNNNNNNNNDDDDDNDDDLLYQQAVDKNFAKSFLGQIDEILAACNHPRVQRCLFSATISSNVENLAASVLRNYLKISIGTPNAGSTNIDQKLVFVGREEGKLLGIRQIIAGGLKPPVLVFMQSKERAKELFQELIYDGINVDVIHAERSQNERDRIITNFRIGEIWVLICTDLMARGIDFKGVNMVINYDFPQSAVSYIHRIGRTGRAGRKGTAITFFTESDMEMLRSIANVMKISGCDVPEWMLTLKKLQGKDKKRAENSVPRRKTIRTMTGFDKAKNNRRKFVKEASKKPGYADNKKKQLEKKNANKKAKTSGGKADDEGWQMA